MAAEDVIEAFDPTVDLAIDYAEELNAQQYQAVTAEPGPALVIAGAGAGKTRTLIYRVAFLLEQGIPPDRILLLTFTNKAAREMMQRVADLLGRELPDLWGGTFHRIGHRILRRYADRLGYTRDFTILDREDAQSLLKECRHDAGLKAKDDELPNVDSIANIFSYAVNSRETITATIATHYSQWEEATATLEDLYSRYGERKRASNAMDFDDLLLNWWRLMSEFPEVREAYQRRFQFILVDEYQDTNRIQSDLIDLLAAWHGNVMAVGDDSQSIYGWRGADFENILSFPERYAATERYPETKRFTIETNYRSTPEILTFANAVIANNYRQFDKKLVTERPGGSRPVYLAVSNPKKQAEVVVERIRRLWEEGAPLSGIAVLYRSHFHALDLQMMLTQAEVPFSITSGIRFFEQAHIKDVAAYLRLVTNPLDEVAFRRTVQRMPGIAPKAAAKLWAALSHQMRAGTTGERQMTLQAALEAIGKQVPKKAQGSWSQLTELIGVMEAPEQKDDPSDLIHLVVKHGYGNYVTSHYQNARARLDDLDQLAEHAVRFSSTEAFLAELALLSNVEAEHSEEESTSDDKVRLSTIHQAKGLEFDVVFVIMLCDRMFPSARSLHEEESLEEERRLFYVAATRAKNELYLIYPIARYDGKSDGMRYLEESKFMKEIPPDLCDPVPLF